MIRLKDLESPNHCRRREIYLFLSLFWRKKNRYEFHPRFFFFFSPLVFDSLFWKFVAVFENFVPFFSHSCLRVNKSRCVVFPWNSQSAKKRANWYVEQALHFVKVLFEDTLGFWKRLKGFFPPDFLQKGVCFPCFFNGAMLWNSKIRGECYDMQR